MRNNTYTHTYNAFSDTVYICLPGEEGLIKCMTGKVSSANEQMVLLVSYFSITMDTVSSDRVGTASSSW